MTPKETYKHTQSGWWILITCGITSLVLILLGWILHSIQFILPVFIIFVVFLVAFPSLTVIVEDDLVKIKFELGLIRKSFKLANIISCAIVKNKWWYGWGIRRFPKGLIFNIWGLNAVELVMNNGKIYRIGTDEPQKLDMLIKSKLTK